MKLTPTVVVQIGAMLPVTNHAVFVLQAGFIQRHSLPEEERSKAAEKNS